jgi:CO/xanthine dehydrogenase Mo-binding subunit
MNAPDRLPARGARRRRLLQGAGGLTVAFSLAPAIAPVVAQTPVALPGSMNSYRTLQAWLRIDAQGLVTIFSGKVELGQGIVTALTQIVADELDVPMNRVRIVSGDTDRSPNEGVTAGSLSVEQSGTALRAAAAEARSLLLAEATRQLGERLPAGAALRTEAGTVIAPNGDRLPYGDLADKAGLDRTISAPPRTKAGADRRLIGQSVRRIDIPGKVTGEPMYIQDLRLPGMLHARLVRPSAPRARLISVDEKAVRAMPGVVAVVRDGSFLAVAAEREEQAIAAAAALRRSARWDERGELHPADASLFDRLKTLPSEDSVVSNKSDAAALSRGMRTLAAEYTRPFQNHASIGPSCSVAQWKDGRLTVWSHAQGPFQQRADLAMSFGLKPEAVRVIHRDGSGCYGHNGADDVGLDAALVARAVGERPVRLQWSREDEFQWEPCGSAMAMRMRASLDADGQIVDWAHELWSHTHSMRPGDPEGDNLLASWYLDKPLKESPARNIPQPAGGGDRNAIPLYDFPNQKVINHLIPAMPVRVSALRTLGAYANVFALESFMDELALVANADPLAFRLRHLKDPRARAVVEKVAAMAGWQTGAPRGNGTGRGIAFARYKNLAVYTAVIAEVTVDKASGVVRVPRAWCAADAGMIVNPDGMINQLEGGIIQSTSWTLLESTPYDRKRMLARSWADYPILRFSDVPAVEVGLIDRPDEPPKGVGEGTQGPMAAAIANAFAQATGVRLRDLPLNPARVKAVLA